MFGFLKSKLTIMDVQGMTCSGCVKGVERALMSVEGVKKVTVSLENKSAEIFGRGFEVSALVQALESKGFTGQVSS